MIRPLLAVRVAAAALILGLAASTARAERWGDQGVGVMVGNPTGFSYKVFVDERLAVDAAFGVDQHQLDAHATLLFHDFNLVRQSPSLSSLTANADIPVYIGIGPRLLFDNDTELGIRLPVGFSIFPHRTPWEIFTELAPVIRLTPESGVDFDFSIGVRYYIAAIRPRSN